MLRRNTIKDFSQFATAIPGEKNVLSSSLSGKTKVDTNMVQVGSLPAGKSFLVDTIKLLFFPGSPVDIIATTATNSAAQADDMYQFIKGGYLELYIGSTTFLTEAPLGRFPSSTGMRIDNSLAGTFAAPNMAKSEYAASTGLIYRVQPELELVSNQNFNVNLNWPVAVATPSTLAARLGVVMRGQLKRNAQ